MIPASQHRVVDLVTALQAVELPAVVNPWSFARRAHADDVSQRLWNVTEYVHQYAARGARVLLVGEAGSSCTTRVTGLPGVSSRVILEDERFRRAFPRIAHGWQKPRDPDAPWQDARSRVLWTAIDRAFGARAPPMLWNVFPWHPVRPELGAWSDRSPLADDEAARGYLLLEAILNIVQPTRVASIGVTAHEALTDLRVPHAQIPEIRVDPRKPRVTEAAIRALTSALRDVQAWTPEPLAATTREPAGVVA